MAMIRRTGQSEEFLAIVDLREIRNDLELLRMQHLVQIRKEIIDRADLLDRRGGRCGTFRRGQIVMVTSAIVRRRTHHNH